jgi:hypothetical protein
MAKHLIEKGPDDLKPSKNIGHEFKLWTVWAKQSRINSRQFW